MAPQCFRVLDHERSSRSLGAASKYGRRCLVNHSNQLMLVYGVMVVMTLDLETFLENSKKGRKALLRSRKFLRL